MTLVLACGESNCNDTSMEYDGQVYRPLHYDEERARQFFVRATHGTNLPRMYRPDIDTVDLGAFADAIIGGYVEQTSKNHREGSVQHDSNLGRIIFVINFLEGMELSELNESIQDNVVGKKKGVREFALGVAGEGARYLEKTILSDNRQELGSKKPTETWTDVTEFIDLGDTVKRLFSEERLHAGQAQALLLMFGLAQSTAPETAQRRAVEFACQDLKPRLRTAIIHQPHHGEKLIDQTFAKGVTYLKAIIGASFGSRRDGSLIDQLIDFEVTDYTDSDQRTACRDQIYGHVGYILDTIYPSR